MVHSDVGCSVTFQCTIRREPISMTTKTYRTRKVAATETKQSQATIALEWLRTKVLHLWLEVPRGPTAFRYLRTVRGEIRRPNLSFNSLAIRSSPRLGSPDPSLGSVLRGF